MSDGYRDYVPRRRRAQMGEKPHTETCLCEDCMPVRVDEEANVRNWRRRELKLIGFPPADAANLAANREVDLGLARELVKAGCPIETAVQILA